MTGDVTARTWQRQSRTPRIHIAADHARSQHAEPEPRGGRHRKERERDGRDDEDGRVDGRVPERRWHRGLAPDRSTVPSSSARAGSQSVPLKSKPIGQELRYPNTTLSSANVTGTTKSRRGSRSRRSAPIRGSPPRADDSRPPSTPSFVKPSLVKTAELLLLGAMPLVALVLALAAYAGDDRLALDFHHELYRQADAVVNGRDAYEAPEADLSDRANLLWPMAAVLPVVPLTAFPPAWRTGSRRRSCSRRSSRRSGCSTSATGVSTGSCCSGPRRSRRSRRRTRRCR